MSTAYEYQLLGRLQSDCEQFLAANEGQPIHLCYITVKDQIQAMKDLWYSFTDASNST